jgi:hypothetical protein
MRRYVRGLRRGNAERIVLVVIPAEREPIGRLASIRRRPRRMRLEMAIRHERGVALAIMPTARGRSPSGASSPPAIVLIDDTNVVGDRAVAVGRVLGEPVRFVHFDVDAEETRELEGSWERDEPEAKLEIVPSPIRELADPVISLVRRAGSDRDGFVSVVFGQIVPRWWQRPLHADEARPARAALARDAGAVLVLIPYQL